jgi:nitroreductase
MAISSPASSTLSVDEVLATTRSVRSGLDLSRPVERELIEECVKLALQAPSGSNIQNAHFVVVTDADKRRALGEVYRHGWRAYVESPFFYGRLPYDDYRQRPDEIERFQQWAAMAGQQIDWLVEHMHEVPVLVIPCVAFGEGVARAVYTAAGVTRDTPLPPIFQAATWGNVLPAATQFRLAARARGLGSCWTVVHLFYEKDAAHVLGIPYDTVMQAALIPVAHASAEEFHVAQRPPLADVLHWDAW